ncbi:hypothetical protein Hanom_Chr02g00098341 [Helianthus anomalus]
MGLFLVYLLYDMNIFSGCFGCDAKSKLTKSQESQPSRPSHVAKPFVEERGEESVRCDVDDNALCVSAIDTPNPTLDSHGTGNTSQEFINHGKLFVSKLLLYHAIMVGLGNRSKCMQIDICHPKLIFFNFWQTVRFFHN